MHVRFVVQQWRLVCREGGCGMGCAFGERRAPKKNKWRLVLVLVVKGGLSILTVTVASGNRNRPVSPCKKKVRVQPSE